MNFFEQQVRTKKSSAALVFLFILCALCITLAVSYPICLIILDALDWLDSFSPVYVFTNTPLPILLTFFICTLIYISYNSSLKMKELSEGSGAYTVKSLCGRLASKLGSAKEAVLINVVEEIAVASGIPPPQVYILDADYTINAFAAGNSYDDAIIGVTAGAVEHLKREELQGVIAHEFSHIFNGDMKLNIFTIGILNGILAIGLAGERLAKSAVGVKGMLLGTVLYIVGYIGLFFGNIIKAALNRQREFLADVTSAQFTRYPKGLADALKKIGGMGSFISSNRSDEFSHLYFANGNKNTLLSAHPNIDKRIYALDPNWDGIYIFTGFPKIPATGEEYEHAILKNKKKVLAREKAAKAAKLLTVSSILVETAQTPRKLDSAAKIIKNIPQLLHDSAGNLTDAQFIIFAVLMESEEEIRKIQREIIAEVYLKENTESAEKFENIESEVLKYPCDLHLNLINISIPTLKALPKEEYLKFKEIVIKLIEADNKVTWRELNLKYLILYPLDIIFGIRKPAHETYIYIGAIKPDAETLLSKLTYHQFNDDERARQAFIKTVRAFGVGALEYVPSQNISIADIERACDTVQKAKIPLRKKILDISIACLKTDGELSTQDIETIHALSALLHLPVPEIYSFA
jgi:Zn-dependent protease with chaperone function